MEYFDTHIHLDDEKFNEDRAEVIQKMQNAGVTRCINMGCNIETSKKAIELSKKYDFIYSAVGIHPEELPQTEEELWKSIEKIEKLALSNEKNVAIGEIGLDYYWKNDNKELQKKAFIKQIELANKLELPIVIHSRDAFIDTIDIIKNHKVNKAGIFHCCQQNQELSHIQAHQVDFSFESVRSYLHFCHRKFHCRTYKNQT